MNIYWHSWFGPIWTNLGCLDVSFAESSLLSLTTCSRGTSSFRGFLAPCEQNKSYYTIIYDKFEHINETCKIDGQYLYMESSSRGERCGKSHFKNVTAQRENFGGIELNNTFWCLKNIKIRDFGGQGDSDIWREKERQGEIKRWRLQNSASVSVAMLQRKDVHNTSLIPGTTT